MKINRSGSVSGWVGIQDVINCLANGWNSFIMSGMGRMARSAAHNATLCHGQVHSLPQTPAGTHTRM